MGSAGEAVGALRSQVCRKGQLLGQTNAKAFKAQPATGLRSCPLHGPAHVKCRTGHHAFSGLQRDTFTPPTPPLRATVSQAVWNLYPGVGLSKGAPPGQGENKAAASQLAPGRLPVKRGLCAGPINNRKCKWPKVETPSPWASGRMGQ